MLHFQVVAPPLTLLKQDMHKAVALCLLIGSTLLHAEEKTPVFREETIDDKIEIGYGLAIADVDGDGKPDILLADKKQFVWYQNPTWTKHVIAENLTEHDNVCIAARDIDGSGKCSIAVGAEWNPGDTVNSGAVFYLIPPADRTQKWEAVKLPAEPTTHRMKWVHRGNKEDGSPRYDLVVVPLHGRGNKNGEGAGVKVLAYEMPKNPRDEWKSQVVCESMHMMHNLEPFAPTNTKFKAEAVFLGGKEGITAAVPRADGQWGLVGLVQHKLYDPPLAGVGELRFSMRQSDHQFTATIEPMHGNTVAVYSGSDLMAKTPARTVLDTSLEDGHALALGDLLGIGRDQIVVGWRAMQKKDAKVGIKMFVPDEKGEHWTQHLIDDNKMSCEDLVLADLNGDGKLDIIASGRRTKNVKIYWNETK